MLFEIHVTSKNFEVAQPMLGKENVISK